MSFISDSGASLESTPYIPPRQLPPTDYASHGNSVKQEPPTMMMQDYQQSTYISDAKDDQPLSSRRAEKRPETDATYREPDRSGHARQPSSSAPKPKLGPTLAEFTQRPDWAWSVIEEIQDWMHVMGPEGNILFAAPSIRAIAGYSPDDVVGRPLDAFIHHDDVNSFNRDMRLSVATGLPLRHHYRLRKKDGRYVIFEVVGHAHYGQGVTVPSADDCKCVFALARPYPSKQAEEVDSFLELKMENELLRQDIERMRLEVANDEEARAALEQFQHTLPAAREAHRNKMSGPRPPHSGGKAFNVGGASHAGKPISANSEDRRRKKKAKIEEGEHICRDCGTVDSPEWRKGPLGPKSLCNACGLRWAKKAKQMQGRAT